jgi:hypothetical protein
VKDKNTIISMNDKEVIYSSVLKAEWQGGELRHFIAGVVTELSNAYNIGNDRVYFNLLNAILSTCIIENKIDLFKNVLSTVEPQELTQLRDESGTNLFATLARYSDKKEFFDYTRSEYAQLTLKAQRDFFLGEAGNSVSAVATAIEANNVPVFDYLLECVYPGGKEFTQEDFISYATDIFKRRAFDCLPTLLQQMPVNKRQAAWDAFFNKFKPDNFFAEVEVDISTYKKKKSLLDGSMIDEMPANMRANAEAKQNAIQKKNHRALQLENYIDQCQKYCDVKEVKETVKTNEKFKYLHKLEDVNKIIDQLKGVDEDLRTLRESRMQQLQQRLSEVLLSGEEMRSQSSKKKLMYDDETQLINKAKQLRGDCGAALKRIATMDLPDHYQPAFMMYYETYINAVLSNIELNNNDLKNIKADITKFFQEQIPLILKMKAGAFENEKVFQLLDVFFKKQGAMGVVLYTSNSHRLSWIQSAKSEARLGAGNLAKIAESFINGCDWCREYFDSRGMTEDLSSRHQALLEADFNVSPWFKPGQ